MLDREFSQYLAAGKRYLLMRKYCFILLAALGLGGTHSALAWDYPTEFWVNEEEGWVVETKPCDDALCGYLVGFRVVHAHPSDYIPKDILNPNPDKHGDQLCGLQLMGGFKPSDKPDGMWKNGWIYDPDNGKTYSGVISTIDSDTVRLRGYVGIPLFGRTLTLRRESGTVERCSISQPK